MKKQVFILMLAPLFLLASCTQSANNENQAEAEKVETKKAVEVNFKDFGPEPLAINIEDYTLQNDTYRTSIWTGKYLQLTVMSIPAGGDIGEEMHPDIDQFLRIEEGSGVMYMGDEEGVYSFQERVGDDFAIFIPAGKWHNLVNDSDKPLKLYSIYALPEHPHSTVHQTKAEGIAAHEQEHQQH